MHSTTRLALPTLATFFGILPLAAAQEQQPADPQPQAVTLPAIETAEDLLEAIEAVDEDLTTLRAGIIYQRFFKLQHDQHTRYGDLYYESLQQPAGNGKGRIDERAFALSFDTLIVDQTKRAQDQTIVFDGEFLVEREVDEEGKRFTKRRIAEPGQAFDPFRVGNQTLIPLPIGQRKDDILARYEAELLAPAEGVNPNNPLLAGLSRSYQLKLTPLPQFAEDERFSEIRLWYRQTDLMPQVSIASHANGDESLVRLTQVRLNEPRDPDLISVAPPEGEGWNVRVEDRMLDVPVLEAEAEEEGEGQ